MNSTLKSVFLVAVMGVASSASAQVVLQNFSSFESPNTFFQGSWELSGDTIGTTSPRSTFSQGAGFYNFVGGTDEDTSGVTYFFDSPLNLSGQTLLSVFARTLAGNVAPTFSISLFDSSFVRSATALFATSAFVGPGFTNVQTAFVTSAGFDATDVAGFIITGGKTTGPDLVLNVAFDSVAVTAPGAVGAVPEPSTYGLVAAGVLLLGVVVSRRFRRSA